MAKYTKRKLGQSHSWVCFLLSRTFLWISLKIMFTRELGALFCHWISWKVVPPYLFYSAQTWAKKCSSMLSNKNGGGGTDDMEISMLLSTWLVHLELFQHLDGGGWGFCPGNCHAWLANSITQKQIKTWLWISLPFTDSSRVFLNWCRELLSLCVYLIYLFITYSLASFIIFPMKEG